MRWQEPCKEGGNEHQRRRVHLGPKPGQHGLLVRVRLRRNTVARAILRPGGEGIEPLRGLGKEVDPLVELVLEAGVAVAGLLCHNHHLHPLAAATALPNQVVGATMPVKKGAIVSASLRPAAESVG